ncbi:MAG: phosphatidylglycerol lysyltransferase domain-containing protein [Lachnospiraceae bacterium]|nr:phosphatidylglycerol lysyltransferase domain-containing protein [Lachnospiraceae bacterium]
MENVINWEKPDTGLCNQILQVSMKDRYLGSDLSAVNLFLLKDKYDIEIAELSLEVPEGARETKETNKVYLRYYNGKAENRHGYGYPIYETTSKEEEEVIVKEALRLILSDANNNNRTLRFCLCKEEQCEKLNKALKELCPGKEFGWIMSDNDADYILNKKSWSHYVGKKFASKRNMVNTFIRNNPNWFYEEINKDKFIKYQREYMEKLSTEWFESHDVEEDDMLTEERISLKHMIDNFNELMLVGGILYADKDKPAAFMIGSRISEKVYDAHFEKGLDEYVAKGAFVLLNKCFASSEALAECEYINVEEDVGISGLRKMKLSYHPEIILKKFYGGLKDE